MKASIYLKALLLVAAVAGGAGCSMSPSRMKPQSLDPASAASAALDLHDANGDGAIDKDEALAAPGLLAAFAQFDADGNERLSEAEIRGRLESWVKSKIAFFATSCKVSMDGRPLEGASVRFIPEPFLGDSFVAIEGVSSPRGFVSLSKVEGMPGPGFPTGLYRVEVTKSQGGQELIPSRYNESTVLGQEVAANAPGLSNTLEFKLSSK